MYVCMYYLDELHEKMDIFGIEFSREIVDGMMQILVLRVRFFSDLELLLPYLFYVLSRRRHFHSKQSTDYSNGEREHKSSLE